MEQFSCNQEFESSCADDPSQHFGEHVPFQSYSEQHQSQTKGVSMGVKEEKFNEDSFTTDGETHHSGGLDDASTSLLMLHSIVDKIDVLTLWNILRRKLVANFAISDLIWDLCSQPLDPNKSTNEPVNTLQSVVMETESLLNDLQFAIHSCCYSVPESNSDSLLVADPLLQKCLFDRESASAARFKLKPLPQLDSVFRQKLEGTHLQGTSVPLVASDLQVKLETFEIDVDGIQSHLLDGKRFETDGASVDKKTKKVKKRKKKTNTENLDSEAKNSYRRVTIRVQMEPREEPKKKSIVIYDSSAPTEKVDAEMNTTKVYVCSICGAVHANLKSHKFHVKKCEGNPKEKKPPFIRVNSRYYCTHPDCLPPNQPSCDLSNTTEATNIVLGQNQESWNSMTFIWRHFSEKHATEADMQFSCSECQKKFLTKGALHTHVRSCHELRYTCRFCGQSFPLGTRLRKHERIHSEGKPFECSHCDFKCRWASSLRAHMIRKHDVDPNPSEKNRRKSSSASVDPSTAEVTQSASSFGRIHVCEVCGKAFYTRQTLQDHQVTHTGARPYVCPVCGKTLRNDSCLRRHLMCVHGVKQTCSVCGKDFSSKMGLKQHQRDFHGMQI